MRMSGGVMAVILAWGLVSVGDAAAQTAGPPAAGPARAVPAAALAEERAIAASISERRMVESVRRLVAFGTRQYGTPSNHAAAAWAAAAFREAGLEVTIRSDAPRDWYEPVSWSVSVAGAPASSPVSLTTTWPGTGSPSGRGEGPLALAATAGAVCLVSQNPTPESTTGCAAVLFDGRPSASSWPIVSRLRGAWQVPVLNVSPKETAPLRARLAAGESVRVAFAVEASRGNGGAATVVATLPGRDRAKHVLVCAHGDSDSGGPGANDNASGVAIVLEMARAMAGGIRAKRIPQPAVDIRFAVWGGEISSTREYLASLAADPSALVAVINYDQSGFGSSKDALYVEPDDVPVNTALMRLVRGVMQDHLGADGFPARAASVRTQGGTDSYVFQPRQGGTAYPSMTLYTSAWDRERQLPVTEGFPPLNWYPDEKPGMVTVDGDAFYHSAGDTPANTTDKEPSNMGWCARVGLLTLLRLGKGARPLFQ